MPTPMIVPTIRAVAVVRPKRAGAPPSAAVDGGCPSSVCAPGPVASVATRPIIDHHKARFLTRSG
jgi:hypothetical protein